MSLPTLVTSGASVVGAWRAQDASVNGSQHVITVPSLVGGSGAAMTSRYDSGGTMNDGPNAAVTLKPTAIDGGPGIEALGNGGLYTTDATILAAGQGSGKTFYAFIRGEWSDAEAYNMACGFEAWVANQACYVENGGFWRVQLDRGSGRRGFGSVTWSGGTYTWTMRADTDVDLELFRDSEATPEATMAFDGAVATWSAFAIGSVARTAAADFPPGIWPWSETWTWSRCAVVSTDSGFLDPDDLANMILWTEGTDFAPPSPGGGGSERIIELAPPACRYLLVASPGGATVRVARVSR